MRRVGLWILCALGLLGMFSSQVCFFRALTEEKPGMAMLWLFLTFLNALSMHFWYFMLKDGKK